MSLKQAAGHQTTGQQAPVHKAAEQHAAEQQAAIHQEAVQHHVTDPQGKTFFASLLFAPLLYLLSLCRRSLYHVARILFASPLRSLFWILICTSSTLFIPVTKPLFTQDYPYTLRVVSPQNQRVFASLSPFGVGFEYDLVNSFASEAGYAVQWIHENDPVAALALLESNKVDLAVGFPENSREATLPAFRRTDAISAGPVHTHGQSVSVQLTDDTLAEHKAKAELPKQVGAAMESEGHSRAKVNTQYVERLYEGESIITDESSWALWQPFAQGAGVSLHEHDTSYCWYWNTQNDKLGAQVMQYWHERNKLEDTMLADLNEQYFNFIPAKLDTQVLQHLQRVMKTRLPRYKKAIEAAAKRYHIDPLLLTAVIFQESHFDPNAVSYTGVRGIMQLTEATANSLGVDRLNPEQSIEGGARYLRLIWDSLVDVGMGEEHRNDMALDAVTPQRTSGKQAKGDAKNGTVADGANGTGANGTGANGTGANGSDGPNGPDGTLSDGTGNSGADGTLANGTGSGNDLADKRIPEEKPTKLIGLTDWNRWCFTLAAFNQGRGHLRDAIRLSKALGGTGLTWHELKRIYPLMSQKAFYSTLRYGRCRGEEAVQFVDNIRWYYYILSGFAFLDGLES